MSIVKQYMKKDDWPFEQEKEGLLKVRFKGKKGSWTVFAAVYEDAQRVQFISTLDEKVPADRRRAVAELLTRMNYSYEICCFQIDFNDGEVRCSTAIDVEGASLVEKQVNIYLYSNVLAMDKYFPAIMAVSSGKKTPKAAFDEVNAK
jgi:hypothetical protein